jgi:hypothetical protein
MSDEQKIKGMHDGTGYGIAMRVFSLYVLNVVVVVVVVVVLI